MRRPLARLLRAALFTSLTLLAGIVPARAAEPVVPSTAEYQRLLNDFLSVTSSPGAPLETAFDYEELYISRGRDERLQRVRTDLLQTPPSTMSPKALKAWAINTYNFLVLESATENLYERRIVRGKLEGRRAYVRKGRSSVRQMPDYFTSTAVTIEGRSYSLNAFEQHFLFADFPRGATGTPPKGLDPRIHFALVCGAQGCPPLQPRAYTAESLEVQLDNATRVALSSPRHLRYVPELQRLEWSQIFAWYTGDFGGPEGAWAFAMRYAPPELKKRMSDRASKQPDGAIVWEWKMNQTPMRGREQPVIPGSSP